MFEWCQAIVCVPILFFATGLMELCIQGCNLLLDDVRLWCALRCFLMGLMRRLYILAVLELEKERETAGEPQQNGDLNEDQTQMTPFEMNLKDKRFVAAAAAAVL